MSENDQLATRAVDALAAVRAIAPHSEHPMRHTARSLKQQAEALLSQAFLHAQILADTAKNTIADYDSASKEGNDG